MSVGAVNKQTGERIPTAGMPAIDNALDLTSVNPVQNAVITAALAGKADTGIVADDFDSTASYVIGNYCIYQGGLYKFKADHTGAWAAADVDAITIAGELTAKQPKTDNNLTTTSKDTTGAINELKNGLTNLTNAQASDLIAVGAPYHDGSGRVYHFPFEHANKTNHNRRPIMIQTASQSGATKIIAALIMASADDASVACSDSDVTYTWSDGVLDILVDCGNAAWANPYIYMPRSLYQSMI